MEEPLVRDKAVESLIILAEDMPDGTHYNYCSIFRKSLFLNRPAIRSLG
jgi:hypothetical protein